MNIMFMETSAKAGHNVKSLFKKIAMSLPGMEKSESQADTSNTSKFFGYFTKPSIAYLTLTFQRLM